MLHFDIVKEMVTTQIAMNDLTVPKWRTANLDWPLAISMEAAEGLASEGWAWWKKPPQDVDNCQMELIDIWHFKMSEALVGCDNDANAIRYLRDGLLLGGWVEDRSVKFNWVHLMQRRFSFRAFNALCKHYQLTPGKFAQLYFCKAELNLLRQHNGYKEGRYLKTWVYQGTAVEDNYAVKKIAASYDLSNVDQLAQFRHVMTACYAAQGAPGC